MPTGIYKRTKEMYLTRLGNKYHLGHHNTEKTKQKMKLIHKKMWQNPEYREKQRLNHKGMLGKHHSPEAKKKIGFANNGEKHANYKGDKVSYNPLHRWVEKRKPKPKVCDFCHKEKDYLGRTKLALANIKNHIYTRNPNDYKWGHYDCHNKFDRGIK